jgi:hypothetical protein
MRILFFAIALSLLAACANKSGNDLPIVRADDPVWGLQPDHLDHGALPR